MMTNLTQEELIYIDGGKEKERDNLDTVVDVITGAVGGVVGIIVGWLG